MTYRNDHEAALMRVEALEGEVARLRKAAEAKPKPVATRKRRRASLASILIGGSFLVAGLLLAAVRPDPTAEAAAPEILEPKAPIAGRFDDLRSCIAAIAPVDHRVDERTTDPRGAAESIDWIAKTGAPCRERLESFETEGDTSQRISRWADTEDRLASTISLITVYYGSEPYALDNYATAAQLWREYHATRTQRDLALAEVKTVLAFQ